MSYGRITPAMLRHMAMLVERGSADGEYRIEHAHEADLDHIGSNRTRYMSELDRYVFEFRVSPSAPSEISTSVERRYTRTAEIPRPPTPTVVVPPPVDTKPAIELLVEIVKVIIRAWTMDDNKIRFAMLELK